MVTGFDQYGDRMPLSWVRLNATSRSFNLTVYTGLNGLYVMILPAGTYAIATYIQGYQSQSMNVTVSPGQLALHDFILRSVFAVSPSPS
jgi:subtilase family serine protease